jgi:LysR family glycine cleavage system transcriptional activator
MPRFAALHPEIDMRLVASNDALDLDREHLDLAIRYTPLTMRAPSHDKLFDYQQFPVCSAALATDRSRPLRSAADLSKHVLLDFETVLYGRPYDWQQWLGAMKLRGAKDAGWLRFSHYDQVIEAALNGGGVAVGKRPHLSQHLRDGLLVEPLGAAGVADLGAFYIEVAAAAPRDVVGVLVTWLHEEAARDAGARGPDNEAPIRTHLPTSPP